MSPEKQSVGSRSEGFCTRAPEGGTPLYGLYRYVRPERAWFFSCFDHTLGINLSQFAAILVINRVSILAILPPFWS